MEPTHKTLPSPPPSQPDTVANTATLGPAGTVTWSHLNLIDQLLHDKDHLLRDKDETVRSKTELWRESYDALRKRDEEVNEHRNRISELEGALRARDEEIAGRKALTRELHAKNASAKSKYRKLAKAFDEHMDECDPDEDVEEHERKSTVAGPEEDAENDVEEVIELDDKELDAKHKQLQELWPICNSKREKSTSEDEPVQKKQRLDSVELEKTRDIPSLLAAVSAKLHALEQRPSEALEDMREEATPSSVTMPGSKRMFDQISESPHAIPAALDKVMPSASANEVSTSVNEAEPSEHDAQTEPLANAQHDQDDGTSLFDSPYLRRQAAKLITLNTGPLIQCATKVREPTRSSSLLSDLTRSPEREDVLQKTQEDDGPTQTASAAMTRLRDNLLLPMHCTIRPLIEDTAGGTFELGDPNIMAEGLLHSIYGILAGVLERSRSGSRLLHPRSAVSCCYVWAHHAQTDTSWTLERPRRYTCRACLKSRRACLSWEDHGIWTVLPLPPAARPLGSLPQDLSYYILQRAAFPDTFEDLYELSIRQKWNLKKKQLETSRR